MSLREGDNIRAYRILRPTWVEETALDHSLNDGLMATSYMASDSEGSLVFLKTYKCPAGLDSWLSGYEDYQRSLKASVDASAELQALTYRFVDFFSEKIGESSFPTYVQVFEFVKGGMDLRKFLNEDTSYSVDKRTTFALLMMYAISKFHEAGIVHCDLKPENMMLYPSDCKMGWNLRVVDFDWAVLDGKKAPWKDAPDGMGYATTPGYSSPEWFNGERPTSASDVFTCGLMLYELLTRDGNPYGGLEGEEYKTRADEFTVSAPDLITSHGAAADENVKKIIHSCLDPQPSNRPNAKTVHSALLAWARGEACSGTTVEKTTVKKGSLSLTAVATGKSLEPMKLNADFGSRLAALFLEADEAKFFGGRLFSLCVEDGVWYVVPDETAANATVLNGRQITERTELHSGDELAVGSRKNASIVKARMKVSC